MPLEAEPDEESSDEEMSNIGTIEVVVLRCDEVPITKGRWARKIVGSSSRELDDPAIEPHPRSKQYWKNWAAEEERVVDPPGVGTVDKEHIKKHNLSSRVTTGDKEVVTSVVFDTDLVFLDSFDKPYCILVMKYRSRSLSHSLWGLSSHCRIETNNPL